MRSGSRTRSDIPGRSKADAGSISGYVAVASAAPLDFATSAVAEEVGGSRIGDTEMALRLQEKPAEPARRLFGTDGIRGVANVYPMTGGLMLQMGRAVAYLIKNGPHRHRVVIGKDTRVSGYMLETALASRICSIGVDVLLCGPLPTPAISNLTNSMPADAGAVISASQNPYQDNGIKFFSRDGFKLPDD